eukprot:3662225-Pyramimonas_sp.AAC.1
MAGAGASGHPRHRVRRLLCWLPRPHGAGRGVRRSGDQNRGGAASGAGLQGVRVEERAARELARAGLTGGQADGGQRLSHRGLLPRWPGL